MKLIFEEKQDIMIALNMRCNYIETGNVAFSANDVENMGKEASGDAKIRALSESQMELLLRMKSLIKRLI